MHIYTHGCAWAQEGRSSHPGRRGMQKGASTKANGGAYINRQVTASLTDGVQNSQTAGVTCVVDGLAPTVVRVHG